MSGFFVRGVSGGIFMPGFIPGMLGMGAAVFGLPVADGFFVAGRSAGVFTWLLGFFAADRDLVAFDFDGGRDGFLTTVSWLIAGMFFIPGMPGMSGAR